MAETSGFRPFIGSDKPFEARRLAPADIAPWSTDYFAWLAGRLDPIFIEFISQVTVASMAPLSGPTGIFFIYLQLQANDEDS